MPNAEPTIESAASKITPLFILQFCVVIIVILIVVFRPGEWTPARWVGLCIAIPSAVLLFIARWQLGRSFSVTPQARKLVTHGVYSKIRNPIYVFSGLLVTGVLIALQYRYAFLLLLVLIPAQIVRARQEGKVLEAKFGDEYRKYREGTWF
jgi:protein-S-isoprenylcysteine O-methyltransferase Ste14